MSGHIQGGMESGGGCGIPGGGGGGGYSSSGFSGSSFAIADI